MVRGWLAKLPAPWTRAGVAPPSDAFDAPNWTDRPALTMKLIPALIALLGLVAPAAAQSERAAVPVQGVVELFTSQGCSSCPAADALLGTLADRPNILAMSFSVDYWDYLGWRDTLANHKFTKRQRAYAKTRGDGQVYTPQIVVNGATHVVGSELPAIEGALRKTRDKAGAWVPLDVRSDSDSLHIECGGGLTRMAAGSAQAATVWFVTMSRKVDIAVTRGENAGKTLTYYNVVREFTPVGMWTGEPLSVRLDKQTIGQTAGADLYAVVLQQGHAGPIIGAAVLPAK